jgi:Rap1a immunity proteins
MIRFTPALLSLVAAITAEPAAGTTSAVELRLACRALEQHPQSPAGGRCRSYLSGFIEGAAGAGKLVLTDSSAGPSSGWEERAARTRIGARLQREAWLHDPEFCLPDPPPIEELASRVAREPVGPWAADARPAADLLRVVLERYYRCARE